MPKLTRGLAVLAASAALTLSGWQAVPAQAADSVTVTPQCSAIVVSAAGAAGTGSISYSTDYQNLPTQYVARGSTRVFSVPAGDYSWTASSSASSLPFRSGRVYVPTCSSSAASRPTVGDENGDGLADLLTVTTTGYLVYYSGRGNGSFNAGVTVGSGWGSTDWISRVYEARGADGVLRTSLIARRTDGSIWLYTRFGVGRYGSGRRIATGFSGYSSFSISPTNSRIPFTGHLLQAQKGGRDYTWRLQLGKAPELASLGSYPSEFPQRSSFYMTRFNIGGWADSISIDTTGRMFWFDQVPGEGGAQYVMSGWSAGAVIVSPGDINGDGYSDIMARGSDGNLYYYAATGTGALRTAVRSGVGWGGIRLMA